MYISLGSAERAPNSLVSAVCVYQHRLRTADRPCGSLPPCGGNASTISRLIRECTGKKLHADLDRQAYAGGQKLLKETNLKVNEVAERTGYMNVRYFTRIFKAAMNMSPSDYRSLSAAFF